MTGQSISSRRRIINLDAVPYIPEDLSYKASRQPLNRARGKFRWNPKNIRLHLSPNQQGGKVINGKKLKRELARAKHTVLGANVLDYLLKYPDLIPDSWKGKGKRIYFWGTIYRFVAGNVSCVRFFFWEDGCWGWGASWLDLGWDEARPAAILVS